MRAARYYGAHDVRIETVEPGAVGPGEVRVEVGACGICGSDLHEYHAGPLTIPDEAHPVTGEQLPITIGHEIGGTVTEVGQGVEVPVGTTVAVNPIIWCDDCRYCDEGLYRLCEHGGFVGLSGGGGGFAESVVVPGETVVPLPEDVPREYAALVEPFTVGVHAVRRSAVGEGVTVAIFGAGPIGWTVLQAARASGAEPIVVSEPRDIRRQLAADSGADAVIDPTDRAPAEAIPEICDGPVDVAYEVAGVAETVNQAMAVTKGGGTVTVVSLFQGEVPVELVGIVTAEQDLVGTAAFKGGPLSDREFSTTIEYFADGTFDPEPLITSRIDLGQIVPRGFERLLAEDGEEVKILVSP